MKILCSAKPPEPELVTIAGTTARVFSCNTVVVGTGAAGFNAADTLHAEGQTDVMIVTEGRTMGTSRNTGSDKQTYYKLTVAGGEPDSVQEMAATYFAGECMDGDAALIEAAFSARCFFKLVALGVPFPHNRHGEYVGYKTDHDPRARATSCGPLTSRFMTERLEAAVIAKGIPIIDGCRVVAIVTAPDGGAGRKAVGLLALDTDAAADSPGLVLFNCANVVYATGGPSGLYHASVYPQSVTCATGAALEAGAAGVNLTESQYGVASTKFRWNLSGSYQQVLPAYISTDAGGNDRREFLDAYFASPRAMLDAAFLKGYQWPFDPRKTGPGGSSIIDIAVYLEIRKGRRVFLDFRGNPAALTRGGAPDWSIPGDTAREYLENSGSLQATPIERLQAMNRPAYKLYLDNGIDLAVEPLEAAVCAQHNNGGLAVNEWWESNLRRFFPVGEVAGAFGVYRPGGAALNSTQVGSARAALYISRRYAQPRPATGDFLAAAEGAVSETISRIQALRAAKAGARPPLDLREEYQKTMDACGAFLRPGGMVKEALELCRQRLASFSASTRAATTAELVAAFVNRDILTAQFAYLSAIAEYAAAGGGSRGSFLNCWELDELGLEPESIARHGVRAELDGGKLADRQCLITLGMEPDGSPSCAVRWRSVKPLPTARDNWFETVYNDWLDGNVIG